MDGPPTGDGPPDASPDGSNDETTVDAPPAGGPLRITELCAQDDGFLIDELGQTEDWIEVANVSAQPVELSGFALTDGSRAPQALPKGLLSPGAARVFFADGQPEQGDRHLSFRLADQGQGLRLLDASSGAVVDDVAYPALGVNEVFARFPTAQGPFARCHYATPGRPNGERCGPPPPPALPTNLVFKPYAWPAPSPLVPPLAITELALRPARFIEVANPSPDAVPLSEYQLRLAPTGPGQPWPGPSDGRVIAWPQAGLAPLSRLAVPITDTDVVDLSVNPEVEGVATLFHLGEAVSRVDFMRPPPGGTLARFPEVQTAPGTRFASCANATPGLPNDTCAAVDVPEVGDRMRRLGSAAEEAALAAGGTEADSQSVKFIVDMKQGDSVFFLSSRDWALHYTFIRERIYGQPRLNRCDPTDAGIFQQGWVDFSNREYFVVDGRRFLLGTLVRYGASGVKTVEFARGDAITGPLMARAFFAVMARVPDPAGWAVRPQDGGQVAAVRQVEGQLPIVEPNAPFRGQTFQPVSGGVAFGVLRFVPGTDLQTAPLGVDTIVVTDEVPNDLPLVGGLVTEAFQTPLSHVGILTKNRGTPDMALVDARNDARLAPFLEKLVRLEVTGTGFTLAETTPAAAQAFWDSRRRQGPRLAPRLDTSVRALVDLAGHGLEDLPSIGSKAAQLAEVMRVRSTHAGCPGLVPTPAGTLAVPVVHSLEHFVASGADAVLARWRADPAFGVDPRVRAAGLAEVRAAILAHPVAPALLGAVEDAVGARFGTQRFRMRSSSNTEDLAEFSGAGLYTSVSGAIGDPKHTVADGLRIVWASLWEQRAYDERELALIDHDKAAMGVLVHDAFAQMERANGVAVSRDVLDPIESGVFSINAQAGEASVTNPAPGVVSDQIVYTPYFAAPAEYRAHSSLTSGPVLTTFEMATLTCQLRAITEHFQAKLDPQKANRWFTMEVEFKILGDARRLMIKQARPYSFGTAEIPIDCREF